MGLVPPACVAPGPQALASLSATRVPTGPVDHLTKRVRSFKEKTSRPQSPHNQLQEVAQVPAEGQHLETCRWG